MTFLKIITFFLLLGFISCKPEKANNQSDYSNETTVADTIALDQLTKMKGNSVNKNYYWLINQPYTGQAVQYEMATDGKWSFVYTFKDGIMQRLDVLGINGYQHRFVEMKNGYDYHMVMFHRNGNRYLEEYYDKDKNRIGIWSRWHESGKLDSSKSFDKKKN